MEQTTVQIRSKSYPYNYLSHSEHIAERITKPKLPNVEEGRLALTYPSLKVALNN